MTPERWAQIRQIFDGALERPQQDRAAYLRVRCARDDELRREVESLLTNYDGSEDFLSTPAAELSRALATLGDNSGEFPIVPRVGPYQLERRIGRGGMGTVWLATRFDREYEKGRGENGQARHGYRRNPAALPYGAPSARRFESSQYRRADRWRIHARRTPVPGDGVRRGNARRDQYCENRQSTIFD